LKIIIFTIFLILFAQADKSIDIIYHNDYKTAQREAKEDKKYLFIVVTAKGCGWCKRLKKTTLKERDIRENLAKDYISVELDRDSSYLPNSIKITGVPSVVIVDPNSQEVIKNIVGFREDSNDYLKWFKYVKILKEE
jgi:thioredoxin-related protein